MNSSDAARLKAGHLAALFLPEHGMLGASLRHRGVELLRRVDDLDAAAAKGSTAGIPLLHPWANRLGGPIYRAAGKEVVLDPASPFLHRDENGSTASRGRGSRGRSSRRRPIVSSDASSGAPKSGSRSFRSRTRSR